MIVGLQMLVGSFTLFVVALQTETITVNYTWSLLAAFSYTTLIPGLLATWVWFVLVDRIGAVRASTFHFLNPFFGVVTAAALLSENLTLFDYSAVTIITLGIVITQRKTKH